MRPYALLYFYRRRLRIHAAQELFAGVGIAVAVALVFAVLVAEGSIAGSASEAVHKVLGPTTLQLRARSPAGFDERLLARVARLAGVKQTAPLLEQSATLVSAGGRHTPVEVAGADTSLAVLDGLAPTLPLAALAPGHLGLSRASASAIESAGAGSRVTLMLRGRAHQLTVGAVLGPEAAGPLSRALVAVMSLRQMQRLAGLPGRVSRILVVSAPGREAQVRAELTRLAGGRLDVASAGQDVALLRQALGPSDLASGLFAAIGALLGLLLAFNAMLLTVPERRRVIADLRSAGTRRGAIVQMVLFQALALGLLASIVGLALGFGLSVWVFHQSSDYLAEAFTLAGGTVVGLRPLLLAGLGGVLATCLASALPLLDLRSARARDGVYVDAGIPGNALDRLARRRMFIAALLLLAFATALFALLPAAAIAATALLALATVLAVPLVFAAVLDVVGVLAVRLSRLTSLPVALASLRSTTLRSLALACTGAVALFGAVSLGGSRANLLSGIQRFSHNYVADAPIWVTSPDDNQAADEFVAGDAAARIARVPAVASVSDFYGGFLTLGSRRVWVIARPPGAARSVLASEIVDGDAQLSEARIDAGSIALSQKLAEALHARVGATLTLPTPSGLRLFRVVATTTNLAWPPGVIFMSAAAYARDWPSAGPTALGVGLRAGADPAAARAAIERALGGESGLEVSLARTRELRIDALTSEGLGQLAEISTLLLLAAIAAMAAALASSIWQRRSWLAGLRLSGAQPRRLRRVLLIEAALMLAAGCLTGALAGVYGQVVVDAYLARVTGFPLASAVMGVRPLEIFAVVLAVSLALASVPGWLASRVSPVLALRDE